MKTLTIRLPDALAAEIAHESRSRRVTKSDVVRERLRRPQDAPALGASTGELIGDLLKQSWDARVPNEPPRFRSPHKQRIAEAIRAKKLRR